MPQAGSWQYFCYTDVEVEVTDPASPEATAGLASATATAAKATHGTDPCYQASTSLLVLS